MSFTTPDLCDEFAAELQVAEPVFRDFGGRRAFAGPIRTLQVFEDNALVRRRLETPGQGCVLVVDGGGSLRRALVGGRLAALARGNDWSGVVVFGCVRDIEEIGETEVGVKALALCPMPAAKAGAGLEDVRVSFAGITFDPGHFAYADENGLLVARRDLILHRP
ncbi:MAG: ribonuclease E activity regulator RraA [Gemmatimonadales bacterium]|nr:ribonuclease E activity regulator RraA [Gemmatimonadales bacterium]